MTISGVSGRTSFLGTQILNLQSEFDDLQRQLTTGKKSDSYAGVGVGRGLAIGLRAQINGIDSFSDTITNVNTRLSIINNALTGITAVSSQIHSAAITSSTAITSSGQTASQQTAAGSLEQMVQLLNSKAGDRFLFSGLTTDTRATASVTDILNGTATQAGLKQLIADRNQADLGTLPATGRLVVTAPPAAGTTVTLAEDTPAAAASPFGLKLGSISSSSTNITVAGPAGTTKAETLTVAANPSAGDKVTLAFRLPDQTTEQITLTATVGPPTQPGEFQIGATPDATAANLSATLSASVQKLANGPLAAASAIQASKEFFASPPQRVDLTAVTPTTATALRAGTPADTVSWYTGEAGPLPARATATAGVDETVSVQYGARANEEAFVTQLQTVAAFAAVTTSPSNPEAAAEIGALYQRVAANLVPQTGQQTIQEIAQDFASTEITMQSATDRHTQTKNTAADMLDSIEGISDEEVSAKILAVQNSLNASFQTTSMLFQTTLLRFLPT